jgi:glycosyltransferase involved in cell wall biosynthesis
VFLEAMAQGLPIVCYDRGGQTDFLRTGETGFVVPLNDQERFKEALLTLHADPDSRRQYGRRNLEAVEQYFIDTCAAKYEQIFESVVARSVHAASSKTVSSSS